MKSFRLVLFVKKIICVFLVRESMGTGWDGAL